MPANPKKTVYISSPKLGQRKTSTKSGDYRVALILRIRKYLIDKDKLRRDRAATRRHRFSIILRIDYDRLLLDYNNRG
jgi:hypothetical protein